jgi:hypothetical protein
MKEEHNHYFKPCPYETLDVYRVISIFGVTDPCIQHALKKLLCSGVRGHKDQSKDIQDVIDTLERWKQMRGEDDKVENKPLSKVSEAVADNTSPLKPWYPDNSWEWVEYDGSGQPVEDGVLVGFLMAAERYNRDYFPLFRMAGDLRWGVNGSDSGSDIVAYKVVKQ